MKVPILMIFSFVMTISAWAKKALEDGRITAAEAFDLIQQLADQLGVPLALDVPEELKTQIETVVAVAETAATVAVVLPDIRKLNPKFAGLEVRDNYS